MKRCPQCNRVESDDALAFCRIDGAALISDSGSITGYANTAKFVSVPASSEIETSVLPHRTDARTKSRTSPITVLPVTLTQDRTRELSSSKRLTVVIPLAALIVVVAVVAGYFYFSRKNTSAVQSIAVMPFVNASGNPDAEYLSDGMTETLINSLSQLPNLPAKACSSVFRYKGKEVDSQTVRQELLITPASAKKTQPAELERVNENRDWFMQRLKTDPFIASLRSDPRYREMLKRPDLPD